MTEQQKGRRHSRERDVTVHEGPMADTHGTQWRKDAVRLEKQNQELIENPRSAGGGRVEQPG